MQNLNMSKIYSEILNQFYEQVPMGVLFQDGTTYTNSEVDLLSGQNTDIIQAVHALKRVFGGEVVRSK